MLCCPLLSATGEWVISVPPSHLSHIAKVTSSRFQNPTNSWPFGGDAICSLVWCPSGAGLVGVTWWSCDAYWQIPVTFSRDDRSHHHLSSHCWNADSSVWTIPFLSNFPPDNTGMSSWLWPSNRWQKENFPKVPSHITGTGRFDWLGTPLFKMKRA